MGEGSVVDARAENAWLRSYPYWDAYFGVVLVATIAIIVVDGGSPVAIVPLLLIAASYALWGRTAVRRPPGWVGKSRWHAASMIVLFTAADVVAPQAAVALSALIPMAFMSLRAAPAAVVMVAMFTGPAIQIMIDLGSHPVVVALAIVLVLSAAALLGVFIDRLGRQNSERARLIAELDRTREELAEVSKEAGMLAERERLAGDIHDTLAQGFTGILMVLQAADEPDRHVRRAMEIARENLAETRALIAALAPPALDGASLEEALGRLARGFELPVEVSVSGSAGVPPAVAEALVRTAQEGLANVRKHARAGTVRLELRHLDGGRVRMSIGDDGRGFDPATVSDGYGLRAMRSRVTRLGGTVTVTGSPGAGTTILVELPCSGC
ncbi:sensor histidine kinase [Nonomuraea jiangxiensis]|uniref:Oxygen sensor histidine kinase NreB n=1 Tax=Nonomuraea jiangxiensis TaxID=633440 RepID=A0A1G7YXG0_9ACTN|nr:sensor histidine kinase [Nonomuraea jiangxiensis]SDH01218.1 Signal transduction histidine kinase [Nonomuraea jiangxiensis]